MVSLIINGKPVCVPEGTSILEAARAANIDIPTLCYLKDLNEIGACVRPQSGLPHLHGRGRGTGYACCRVRQ